MILRNKGTNTVKRYEGGWIVCTPGSTVTVSEEAGAYLLKAEPHQWEKVQEKGEEKSPPSPLLKARPRKPKAVKVETPKPERTGE